MPPRRNPTPSYRPHKQSGRARATWTDPLGGHHQKLLPGPFDSSESRAAFGALVLEIETSPHAALDGAKVPLTEVLNAFMDFAEEHYVRPDGTQTHEVSQYGIVVRYTRELYPELPAVDFGPIAFKVVRKRFIAAGWCRSLVNQRANRLRRILKWAVEEELVPPSVYEALAAVAGLQRGRSKIRETPPVLPVDEDRVDATLPFLSRHVRGLVQFQRFTGCRPGEGCTVRRADIDTGGAVWLYRPELHKGTWRGKERIITIGPQAQQLLREFFTPRLDDYLFSPRRNVAEFHAKRAAGRKTPLYPSHAERNRKVRNHEPELVPSDLYTVTQYGHAIARACDRAFPAPGELARKEKETAKEWKARLTEQQRTALKTWQKANRWAPNQLRHTHGTKVRKEFGLEAAQVALGHSKADVTQIYAERNLQLAVKVAEKLG